MGLHVVQCEVIPVEPWRARETRTKGTKQNGWTARQRSGRMSTMRAARLGKSWRKCWGRRLKKGLVRRRKSAWRSRRTNRSGCRMKMRGWMRLWTPTEGMTRPEGVVVRFVRGKVMPSSKARTQHSTMFALERQLAQALAPFASDTRNLPDGPSRWVVISNRETNPTISRRPRRRPGFSHLKISLFSPLLVPS